MGGEDEDLQVKPQLPQAADELDPRASRQSDVGDQECRLLCLDQRHGIDAVRCLTGDLQIRFKFKQRAQTLAQDRMVLDQVKATPRLRDDQLTWIGRH